MPACKLEMSPSDIKNINICVNTSSYKTPSNIGQRDCEGVMVFAIEIVRIFYLYKVVTPFFFSYILTSYVTIATRLYVIKNNKHYLQHAIYPYFKIHERIPSII